MADPTNIACTQDAWTQVAAAVTNGQLFLRKTEAVYWYTYRDAGGVAPTTVTDKVDEGILMRPGSGGIPISSSASIDVYVWCENAAGEIGAHL
jgi:hypothetical protein